MDFRTDLASERFDIYKKKNNLSEVEGIKVDSIRDNKLNIVTVDVLNENGSKHINKDIGKYITIEIEDFKYMEELDKQNLIDKLSNEIRLLVGDVSSAIIIGLGNLYVTPDALGPKVVKYTNVTRHLALFAKEYITPNTKQISAISPGVLGTTGIETSEIIESIVNNVKPNIAIVIDALASSSMDRVANTIQLTNTGITPGSGVKNTRDEINEKKLSIPVIAIGVPTVVDLATITNEAIDKVIDKTKIEIEELSNENTETFNLLKKDGRYNMISNILDTQNYIVTPKEIDEVIDKMSEIIASSINKAL